MLASPIKSSKETIEFPRGPFKVRCALTPSPKFQQRLNHSKTELSQLKVKRITLFEYSDLEKTLLGYARKEGWHYSEADVLAFLHNAHVEVYGLYLKDEIIGSIILSHYSVGQQQIFAVGAFIINERFRNRKYGQFLWEKVLTEKMREPNNVITLCSVPRAKTFYARYGFFSTGLETFTMQQEVDLGTKKRRKISYDDIPGEGHGKFQFKPGYIETIVEFEKRSLGVSSDARKQFLQVWFERADFVCLHYDDARQVDGYCVVTKCDDSSQSYRIAPMYANSKEVAEQLLLMLKQFTPDSRFSLSINLLKISIFVGLLTNYGFSEVADSETTLMVNKFANIDISKAVVATSPYEYPHESTWTYSP